MRITTNADSVISQSELEANACEDDVKRGNLRVRSTESKISFGFICYLFISYFFSLLLLLLVLLLLLLLFVEKVACFITNHRT